MRGDRFRSIAASLLDVFGAVELRRVVGAALEPILLEEPRPWRLPIAAPTPPEPRPWLAAAAVRGDAADAGRVT